MGTSYYKVGVGFQKGVGAGGVPPPARSAEAFDIYSIRCITGTYMSIALPKDYCLWENLHILYHRYNASFESPNHKIGTKRAKLELFSVTFLVMKRDAEVAFV